MRNIETKLVFVGGNGFVYGISTIDGSVAWERALKSGWFKSGNPFVSLMEDNEFLYAFSYGTLFKIEKNTGAIIMTGKEIKKLRNHAGVFSADPDASTGSAMLISDDMNMNHGHGSGHAPGEAGHGGGGGH